MNQSVFEFTPAPWLPFRDTAVLDRVRNMTRQEMESFRQENPHFSVRIVYAVQNLFVTDLFERIRRSDREDTRLTVLLPNPCAAAYENVAEMCCKYRVSCRNVHFFFLNEWADQDGNVAPLDYPSGLGHSFMKFFYSRLDEELRPPMEQVHFFTTGNVADYSRLIDDCGEGGADVCYTMAGWSGRIASIDPGGDFAAETMEEFLTLTSRIVTPTMISIAEDSLYGIFRHSGDLAAVPPKAATVGPRDIAHARYRMELQDKMTLGATTSWQRLISRLMLYGPVTPQVPASMLRLFPGICYVAEEVAAPIVRKPDTVVHYQ